MPLFFCRTTARLELRALSQRTGAGEKNDLKVMGIDMAKKDVIIVLHCIEVLKGAAHGEMVLGRVDRL